MFDWLHVSSHANWFHTFWSRTLALGLGCNLYRIQFLVSPGYQLKQIERISTEHELHFNSIRRTLWAVENKRTLTVLQVRPSAISTLHAISHKALTEFCHLCRVCGQSDSWREIGCVFLELKFYRCCVFFSLCCVCVCVKHTRCMSKSSSVVFQSPQTLTKHANTSSGRTAGAGLLRLQIYSFEIR